MDSPAWQSALGVAEKRGTKELQIANSFSRLGSYYLQDPQNNKLTELSHECALKTQIRLFGLAACSGFDFFFFAAKLGFSNRKHHPYVATVHNDLALLYLQSLKNELLACNFKMSKKASNFN